MRMTSNDQWTSSIAMHRLQDFLASHSKHDKPAPSTFSQREHRRRPGVSRNFFSSIFENSNLSLSRCLLPIWRQSSMKITSGSHSRWRWTYRKRCQTMASRVLKSASLAPLGHISAAKDFASSFWLFLVRDNGGIFNFSFFFFKTFFFLQRNEIIGRCFISPIDRANSCTFVGKFENANMPRI